MPDLSTGALPPRYYRNSRQRSYHVRATVLWDPTDRLSARLKANLVRDNNVNAEGAQLASCTGGANQVFGPRNIPFIVGDDCKLNRFQANPYLDPAQWPGIINNGVPFIRSRQKYGTLELNYDFTDALSLNSTTGYYHLTSANLYLPSAYGAAPPLAPANNFNRRDFTQELRLSSDFSGPINLTAGAFYQDARMRDRIITKGNRPLGFAFFDADGQSVMNIKTYSLFGQLRWKIAPSLEIAGGARWTDEKRDQQVTNLVTNTPINVITPRIGSKNVAPEFTITYTPTDDLTVFAAYKQAYKSGSFTIGTVPTASVDNSFGDEKVHGGEAGIKARLFDRQLQANLAGYYYKYTGLQVGAIVPPEAGQLPVNRIINAGAARTYGIDFDVAFRPRNIPGLDLNASFNWNNGKYSRLDGIPCWVGQTVALGCNEVLNTATGLYTAQSLSGTPLIRAPKVQANFGFSYELPVASDFKLVFANSNQYSSKYVRFLAINRPNDDNYQGSFIKIDASVALRGPDDRWEVALIGKNINDKVTSGICSAGNYAGGLFVTPVVTGGTDPGPVGFGQTNCFPERGRSVWLRLTFRPLN